MSSIITTPQVHLLEDQVREIVVATATAYAMYQRQAAGMLTSRSADWLDIACRSMKFIAIMARVELEQVSALMSDTFSPLAAQGDYFGGEVACDQALTALLAEIHS